MSSRNFWSVGVSAGLLAVGTLLIAVTPVSLQQLQFELASPHVTPTAAADSMKLYLAGPTAGVLLVAYAGYHLLGRIRCSFS